MKVEATRVVTEPKFEPLTLTLTLETVDEALAIHAVFNYGGVCDVLHEAGIASSSIRARLEKAYPNIYPASGKYHQKLVDRNRK